MSQLEPITSLTHNISSTIFRVSRLIRHKRLREELESASISLVRDITFHNINSTERLVRLTESVGEMGEVNAGVLCRELNNLKDMIHSRDAELPEQTEDVDINSFFGAEYNEESVPQRITPALRTQRQSPQSKDRQTAILQFIRQFPDDCQMKDLVKEFPGVSERTLRNDIQKLISEKKIERLGGKSGPFSYFRVLSGSVINEESKEQGVEGSGVSTERILLPSAKINS